MRPRLLLPSAGGNLDKAAQLCIVLLQTFHEPLQVTKLDTDTKSASARPGAAAPAKGAAPPPTAHNPHT